LLLCVVNTSPADGRTFAKWTVWAEPPHPFIFISPGRPVTASLWSSSYSLDER
jgi:hypothetical protein